MDSSQFIRLAYWAFSLKADTVSGDMMAICCPLFEVRIWPLSNSYILHQSWLQDCDYLTVSPTENNNQWVKSQRSSLYSGSIPIDVKFYCQWMFFWAKITILTLLSVHFLSLSCPSWHWQSHTNMLLTAKNMTYKMRLNIYIIYIYDVIIIFWVMIRNCKITNECAIDE